MSFKSGISRKLPAASRQLSATSHQLPACQSTFQLFILKPGFKFGGFNAPLLLLLHGSNVDDILVIGVGAYLVIMFGLAQLKARRIRREKLRRKAERAAARTQAAINEPLEITEEKISPDLEN